jgi:hypothetical protein
MRGYKRRIGRNVWVLSVKLAISNPTASPLTDNRAAVQLAPQNY